MISRDYSREIGMPAGERPVSKSVTIAIIALVLLGGATFVWQIILQKPAAPPAPAEVSSR